MARSMVHLRPDLILLLAVACRYVAVSSVSPISGLILHFQRFSKLLKATSNQYYSSVERVSAKQMF